MKKHLLHLLVFFSCFLLVNSAKAKIVMPTIFSDNMVLQQQTKVAIWGSGMQQHLITVTTSWNNEPYQTESDNNGYWKVWVTTPKAGGPFTIKITDTGKIILNHVLVGEVWFCSGQSNMEMPMRGFPNQPVLQSNETIADADNGMLSLFTVERNATAKPQFNTSANWNISSPLVCKTYSAVAYQFGSMLQKKLNIPVGVIVSTWGGTRIQSWMSANALSILSEEKLPLNIDTIKDKHKLANTLFNAMVAPIAGYGIKGFLWYQGESNRHEPIKYEQLFPAMVNDWRKAWSSGDSLPFYYVQIAPFESKDSTRSGRGIREAQLKSSFVIPNCGMVTTTDIGTAETIHPADKLTVSKRLLNWALVKNYGYEGVACEAPRYKEMMIEADKINISFYGTENGLTTYGKEFTNLEIAGEDKIFYVAQGKIETNKTLTVWSNQVSKPLAVRYAYKEFVQGELYNTAGLPASSFRTDNW